MLGAWGQRVDSSPTKGHRVHSLGGFLDVGNIHTGAQCPGSHPMRTQVDNTLRCYTLDAFCETINPTWYDDAQGLYCPGANPTTTELTTTTTPGPTTTLRAPSPGDHLDVGSIHTGAQCPGSHPMRTQVDNTLRCYTLDAFCETINPTWYDDAQGLYCPLSTTTTTTSTSSTSPDQLGEPSPEVLGTVRVISTGGYVAVDVQRPAATQRTSRLPDRRVVIRLTRPGSPPIVIRRTLSGIRSDRIIIRRDVTGYRIVVFVAGKRVVSLEPNSQ
jgi:hypothetical protein